MKLKFQHVISSVHVVVATPGRILDLIERKVAVVKNCGMLVLDEVSCFYLISLSMDKYVLR